MKLRKLIKTTLAMIFASSLSFSWAAGKEEIYRDLMQNGDPAEIIVALKKDKSMAQTKLGESKDSLLMTALKYDRSEPVIKALYKADSNLNAKNKLKQTALMYVCTYSTDEAVIKFIITKTADSSKIKKISEEKDKSGKSALDYAQENSSQMAFNILNNYINEGKASSGKKKKNEVIVLENESEPEPEEAPAAEAPVEKTEEETPVTDNAVAAAVEVDDTATKKEEVPAAAPVEEAPAVVPVVTVVPSVPPVEKKEEPVQSSPTVNKYDKTYLYDFITIEEDPEPEEEPETQSLALVENPDKTDKNGRTALMLAVKDGNDWEIKSLLYSKADVNLKDKDGWTALMYACRYQNNLEVVNLLLDKGANPSAKNKFGATPLQIASTYSSNPDILKKLINSATPNSEELFKAFILSITSSNSNALTQVTKIKVFIERGIAINRFYEGKTPLMYAAEFASSTDVIKILLDNGAVTGVRTADGKTAFTFAESNKHLEHNTTYWSLNGR